MGMYSYVEYEDIHFINKEGLKKYVMECRNGTLYDGKLAAAVVCLLKPEYREEKTLSLDQDFLLHNDIDIDGWKIISYWYNDFVTLLNDLSAFVEGTIVLNFETGDEKAHIEFKGTTTIEHGEMRYQRIEPQGLKFEEPEIVKRSRILKSM